MRKKISLCYVDLECNLCHMADAFKVFLLLTILPKFFQYFSRKTLHIRRLQGIDIYPFISVCFVRWVVFNRLWFRVFRCSNINIVL